MKILLILLRAHNPEVASSNLALATNKTLLLQGFLFIDIHLGLAVRTFTLMEDSL